MAGAEPIFIPSAEIDWVLLGRAVEFYKAKGYTYLEAPWAVSAESVAITCPHPKYTATVDGLGALVGSAEQSLLHLDLATRQPLNPGVLPPGRYVACSPCFRLGDMQDELHQPYFMKVELYANMQNDFLGFARMAAHAGELFRQLGATKDMLDAPATDEGFDITIGGIEVGSYGVRTVPLDPHNEKTAVHGWHYGTGLALPRFSQALKAAQQC